MTTDATLNAEEALQRAKEIAAKLRGETFVPTNDNNGDPNNNHSNKRKRWGVMPNNNEDATTMVNKKPATTIPTTTTTTMTTRRLWITKVSKERPAAHYLQYLKPKLPDVVEAITGIKPNDDDDHNDNNNENDSSASKLKILIKGKGTTAPIPGMPEEPLHVFIQACDFSTAMLAEARLEPFIIEADTATVDESALVATPQLTLAELSNYQPKSVSTLIALPREKLAAALLHGDTTEHKVIEEIQIPNSVVGYVIGRGGENIIQMQAKTLTKIQIQKEHEILPGQTFRKITLSGPAQSNIDQCKDMILSMVAERTNIHNNNNSSSGNMMGHRNASAPQATVFLDVPDADVGLVIGKGGCKSFHFGYSGRIFIFGCTSPHFAPIFFCVSLFTATIHQIQEQTGANIQIPKAATDSVKGIRTLTITCSTEEGANRAKALVAEVLQAKLATANFNNNNNAGASNSAVTIAVEIPDRDVGLCIGRQGCVIKHMQNTTHTRIQIPHAANPGENFRVAKIIGPDEASCQQAKDMIQRIITEQSSAGVLSGAPPVVPTTVTVDNPQYSAEWAAYHAAQAAAAAAAAAQPAVNTTGSFPATHDYYGNAGYAAAVSQTASTNTTVAAAVANPAATVDYEPFFRYAYYYGEDAARAYYKEWSPPIGTSNPYGANPALQQIGNTPVVTTAAQASTAAANPAAGGGGVTTASSDSAAAYMARDSSRRHVSNLPAWMTNVPKEG
jgi:far upstream element-binding protein